MLSTVEVSSTTGSAVMEDVSKRRVDVASSADVVVTSFLWLLFVGVVSLCTIDVVVVVSLCVTGVVVVVSLCVTGMVVIVVGRVTTSGPHFNSNLPVARNGKRTDVSCHTHTHSVIHLNLKHVFAVHCKIVLSSVFHKAVLQPHYTRSPPTVENTQ